MKHPESDMQIACKDWFNLQYPKYSKLLFAIANGGSRNPREAQRLKREGVVPGVCDFMLAIPSKGFLAAFIELKVKPNKPSQEQTQWMKLAEMVGFATVVIYSTDQFREWVTDYIHEINIKDIEKVVCKSYGVTPEKLHSKSQKREYSEPRHVIMFIAHATRKLNNTKAAYYYLRDPSTCHHARKVVVELYNNNKQFHDRLLKILEDLHLFNINITYS